MGKMKTALVNGKIYVERGVFQSAAAMENFSLSFFYCFLLFSFTSGLNIGNNSFAFNLPSLSSKSFLH